MADRLLPPSRFGAGHTVGGPAVGTPGRLPPTADATSPVVSPAPAGVHRLALLSLLLVVFLGPLAAPVAVPMAAVARGQAARSGQSGEGLAKAAIFIGLAYLTLAAVVIVLRVAVGS